MNKKENNYAFIDGQNLFMGTTQSKNPWEVDLYKFKIYLQKRFKVRKAYYFLGFVQEQNKDLYEKIQNAGFILMFKEHNSAMLGKKKGNVDSDIIFYVMKKLYKREDFNKVVFISGDGDYKMLIDFLIEENRFKMLLFPNKEFASSLYKKMKSDNFTYLEDVDIKRKIR